MLASQYSQQVRFQFSERPFLKNKMKIQLRKTCEINADSYVPLHPPSPAPNRNYMMNPDMILMGYYDRVTYY